MRNRWNQWRRIPSWFYAGSKMWILIAKVSVHKINDFSKKNILRCLWNIHLGFIKLGQVKMNSLIFNNTCWNYWGFFNIFWICPMILPHYEIKVINIYEAILLKYMFHTCKSAWFVLQKRLHIMTASSQQNRPLSSLGSLEVTNPTFESGTVITYQDSHFPMRGINQVRSRKECRL